MLILLIGQCGSGKTWVMKKIIESLDTKPAELGLFKFRIDTEKNIAVMGVYDGTTFEGTDRLSMAVMKDVEKLHLSWRKNHFHLITEGDRFTNKTFIAKFEPIIIKIEDDGALGRQQRGSTQTERHIKSIKTRINNIKETHLVANSGEALHLIKKIINI